MSKYSEYDIVQKCLLTIEHKLNWGSSAHWHNDVFIELSETIHQATHILLSPTTLKRVWGKVNYDSAPSISTLNALALFAGYSNWRDFKNKLDDAPSKSVAKSSLSSQRIIITSAAALTLLFISLFSMIGLRENPSTIDYSNVLFKSRLVTNEYPNSVVFDFDIDSINSDSIHIQQYWDPTKTINLKKGQKQATGIYYYPGHFRAKLVVDGAIVKQHDLFLKSEGWISTIDYEPVPKYRSLGKPNVISELQLPDELQKEILTRDRPVISTFHYVSDLGIASGDNFSIESTLKSAYAEKWAVCQKTWIYLLGTRGAIIIPFSKLGCVSNINLMLNGPNVSGKEHDLSAFGVDLFESKNIKIDVVNKQVTVSIEDKVIYIDKYEDTMGELVGLRYKFLGMGEVSNIKISSN